VFLVTPVRVFVDRVVKHAAERFGREYLPLPFNGRWITVPREDWYSFYVRYEPEFARILRHELRPGDTFVDVGAHMGHWSQYAAKLVGESGTAIAFEPSPAYEVLVRTARSSSVIKCFNIGIAAKEGDLTFYEQGTAGSGSFIQSVTEINRHFQPDVPISPAAGVKVRPLDEVLEELGVRPTLIKVDVEGFELEVMQGATRVLEEVRCPWLMEIHPEQLKLSGGSDSQVRDLFSEKGYALHVLSHGRNGVDRVVARPRVPAARVPHADPPGAVLESR
jgi:FkbM family methyltransferase